MSPVGGLRALLLHGDPGAVSVLASALESRCFEVRAATDGTRGLDLLLDELLSLDVVVVDAALPDRDAKAFAELIRRAGGERDLAIVVVAHDPTPELRASLFALGVDALVDPAQGPETVAAAAVGAVVARGTRILDGDDARDEEPAPPPVASPAPRPMLPFVARWSLAPA